MGSDAGRPRRETPPMPTTHVHTYTPKHSPAPRPNPAHRRPWHKEAVFGEGARRVLSARERDEFVHLLWGLARAGLIPPGTVWTGLALLSFIDWKTGRCDPSVGALAQRVRDTYGRRSDRTVERDLVRLRDLGAITWEQRLIRVGPWRSEQRSNQYQLHPDADRKPWALPVPALPRAKPFDDAFARGEPSVSPAVQPAPLLSLIEPRRGSEFSDIVTVGGEQHTSPPATATSAAQIAALKEARFIAECNRNRALRGLPPL